MNTIGAKEKRNAGHVPAESLAPPAPAPDPRAPAADHADHAGRYVAEKPAAEPSIALPSADPPAGVSLLAARGGVKFSAIELLRTLARAQSGISAAELGALLEKRGAALDDTEQAKLGRHEEIERKLKEIQTKLTRMANELDAAPNPLERAKIVFRAMTLLDTPIPDGHALPRAHQAAVVHGAVTMLAALAARTVVSVHTLPQAITLVLGALAGGAIGDRASAIVHHALDNYGFDQVGFLRDIAREFQAHHAEPMKVTQETWALTAFAASQFAAVPLAAALILDPGIGAGAAAGMIALVALMAQENHKMAHRPSDQVPILYDVAQLFGLSLTKGDHMAHHAIESAHADHYNVVTGTKTDDGPFFRAWERSIYRLTGVEPNSWKLDPDLKIQALGARGYDPRKEEAVEIRDRELAALKREYQQQKKLPPEQRTITSRDLRKKAEEIPDESRAAPNDAGARSIFDLRPWR